MLKNTEFAKNLKRIRLEKGLTQKELGEMAGVDFTYISAYENGRRFPRNSTLALLAKTLACDVKDLSDKCTLKKNNKLELNTIADVVDCLFAVQQAVSESFCIFEYTGKQDEVRLLIDKKEICEAITERLSLDCCYYEQDLSDWAYDACKEAWRKIWSKRKLTDYGTGNSGN